MLERLEEEEEAVVVVVVEEGVVAAATLVVALQWLGQQNEAETRNGEVSLPVAPVAVEVLEAQGKLLIFFIIIITIIFLILEIFLIPPPHFLKKIYLLKLSSWFYKIKPFALRAILSATIWVLFYSLTISLLRII